MTIGYTAGVFDLFHVGHLNMLKNAKALCDKLIVGVTTDELVLYKHKKAVIPFDERLEIVRSIKYVDAAVAQDSMDKFVMWEKLKFDIMFVGDDWYGSTKWKTYDEQFQEVGVKIIYFPYYKGTSSTLINHTLLELRNEGKTENGAAKIKHNLNDELWGGYGSSDLRRFLFANAAGEEVA